MRLFSEGSGEVTVNGKKAKEYFIPLQVENLLAPLVIANAKGSFDLD